MRHCTLETFKEELQRIVEKPIQLPEFAGTPSKIEVFKSYLKKISPKKRTQNSQTQSKAQSPSVKSKFSDVALVQGWLQSQAFKNLAYKDNNDNYNYENKIIALFYLFNFKNLEPEVIRALKLIAYGEGYEESKHDGSNQEFPFFLFDFLYDYAIAKVDDQAKSGFPKLADNAHKLLVRFIFSEISNYMDENSIETSVANLNNMIFLALKYSLCLGRFGMLKGFIDKNFSATFCIGFNINNQSKKNIIHDNTALDLFDRVLLDSYHKWGGWTAEQFNAVAEKLEIKNDDNATDKIQSPFKGSKVRDSIETIVKKSDKDATLKYKMEMVAKLYILEYGNKIFKNELAQDSENKLAQVKSFLLEAAGYEEYNNLQEDEEFLKLFFFSKEPSDENLKQFKEIVKAFLFSGTADINSFSIFAETIQAIDHEKEIPARAMLEQYAEGVYRPQPGSPLSNVLGSNGIKITGNKIEIVECTPVSNPNPGSPKSPEVPVRNLVVDFNEQENSNPEGSIFNVSPDQVKDTENGSQAPSDEITPNNDQLGADSQVTVDQAASVAPVDNQKTLKSKLPLVFALISGIISIMTAAGAAILAVYTDHFKSQSIYAKAVVAFLIFSSALCLFFTWLHFSNTPAKPVQQPAAQQPAASSSAASSSAASSQQPAAQQPAAQQPAASSSAASNSVTPESSSAAREIS